MSMTARFWRSGKPCGELAHTRITCSTLAAALDAAHKGALGMLCAHCALSGHMQSTITTKPPLCINNALSPAHPPPVSSPPNPPRPPGNRHFVKSEQDCTLDVEVVCTDWLLHCRSCVCTP